MALYDTSFFMSNGSPFSLNEFTFDIEWLFPFDSHDCSNILLFDNGRSDYFLLDNRCYLLGHSMRALMFFKDDLLMLLMNQRLM